MLVYTINCYEDEHIVTINEVCFKGTVDNYGNIICNNMCVCKKLAEAECMANALNDALYDNANSVVFESQDIPEEYKKEIDEILKNNSDIEDIIGMQISADLLENIDVYIYAALIDKDSCCVNTKRN